MKLEKGLVERMYVGALEKACRGVTDRSCHVNPVRAKPIFVSGSNLSFWYSFIKILINKASERYTHTTSSILWSSLLLVYCIVDSAIAKDVLFT